MQRRKRERTSPAEPLAAADAGRILAFRDSTALQRPALLSWVVRPRTGAHDEVRRDSPGGHRPAADSRRLLRIPVRNPLWGGFLRFLGRTLGPRFCDVRPRGRGGLGRRQRSLRPRLVVGRPNWPCTGAKNSLTRGCSLFADRSSHGFAGGAWGLSPSPARGGRNPRRLARGPCGRHDTVRGGTAQRDHGANDRHGGNQRGEIKGDAARFEGDKGQEKRGRKGVGSGSGVVFRSYAIQTSRREAR